MTRAELETWAKDTLQVYHTLANYDWSKVPAFYTQSDLTKIVGMDNVDVFIAGINPGSDGSYLDMINNPNWCIDHNVGMTPQQLISGSFCINPDKGNLTSWQLHETWPYFKRLKGYFSLVNGGNPLEDEKRFILTNASFFATCKACQLPKTSIQQTILCTIELIKKSSPKRIVFLSGKATFKILKSIKSDTLKFEHKSESNDILHGFVNGIPCLGLPHPSARLSNARRQEIAQTLKYFYETGEIENALAIFQPTEKSHTSNLMKEERRTIMQELFRFIESHHSELQHISMEEGHRRGHVGFSNVHSTYELYFTDVKDNGIQIFTQESPIIELLTKQYSFAQDKKDRFKLTIDYSKVTSPRTSFIDEIINKINCICSTLQQ